MLYIKLMWTQLLKLEFLPYRIGFLDSFQLKFLWLSKILKLVIRFMIMLMLLYFPYKRIFQLCLLTKMFKGCKKLAFIFFFFKEKPFLMLFK